MPSFDYQTELLQHNLDHEILKNSPISAYHDLNYLNHDIQWLQNFGYEVFTIDAAGPATLADFMTQFQSLLFGAGFEQARTPPIGLDAFSDYFSDLVEKYLANQAKGVLIVIKNIDRLYALDHEFVTNLLQILAYSSHNFMIYGVRLITLIYSQDSTLKFACSTQNITINSKEFFKI